MSEAIVGVIVAMMNDGEGKREGGGRGCAIARGRDGCQPDWLELARGGTRNAEYLDENRPRILCVHSVIILKYHFGVSFSLLDPWTEPGWVAVSICIQHEHEYDMFRTEYHKARAPLLAIG